MQIAEELRKNIAGKAARNVQRGCAEDEKTRGLFRPEIKLDLQRSRLMTESFKQTDGRSQFLRQNRYPADLQPSFKPEIHAPVSGRRSQTGSH
jgi:hypothetical protein